MAAPEIQDFQMSVRESPQAVELTLRGTISETTVLDPRPAAGRVVVIDAQGIERINSMGVRAWIGFMDALSAQGSQVVVRKLSPAMVTQASMISSFLGRARVESFLSPWFCPGCEHTLEQLHGFADPLPESIACPKCGKAMELDWDRDAYLAFREV